MSQNTASSFPVLFTSLSTILLCFFIYLNTLTKGASPHGREILASVQKSVGVSKAPPIDIRPLKGDYSEALTSDIRALGLEMKQQEDELVVILSNNNLFLPNSAELSAQSITALNKLAALLLPRSAVVTIDTWQQTEAIESWPIALDQLATLTRLFLDSGFTPKRLRPRAHPFRLSGAAPTATIAIDLAT